MKGKFELSVNFECATQEEFDKLMAHCHNGVIAGFGFLDSEGEFARPNKVIVNQKILDLTDSKGDYVFGKFNPTANAVVEELKERSARIYDLIETLKSDNREKAMIKTAAQVGLLNVQMDAVKVLFM